MRMPVAILVVGALGAFAAPRAWAGGGPETTVVVVNADSPASLRVANAYARLRHIPPSHLVFLPGVPTLGVTDLATFRTRLWAPLKLALSERGLLESTDLIAWSADFPFAVDVGPETKECEAAKGQGVPLHASLTTLTYLWRRVEAQDLPGCLDLEVNHYLQREVNSTRAFHADWAWTARGERDTEAPADSRERYVLSVMLGYTGPFGNSVPEVLACLERAASSDGTRPDGTVYFCRSEDAARTGPREPMFEETVKALESMGRKARVLRKGEDGQDGVLPLGKDDVLGAVVGIADFSWPASKSRLLPGSIAEHLTSFGADFSQPGQTKLSEFLRHGAAGSSGAVTEPKNYPHKFPLPYMHVHYAAGCSLAEAFFQSLAGPWQTLVVGDPLTRPFARFAKVEVPAVAEPLKGTVEVAAKVTPAEGTTVGALELWVDGVRRATGPADKPLAWDTTSEDDGLHDVRVVAVEAGPIETRSFGVSTRLVANAGRTATLTGPKGATALGEPLALSGKAEGAKEVDLLEGARVLATVPVHGGAFQAKVETEDLGQGPVTLLARARFEKGAAARSAPLEVEVGPPPPSRAAKAGKPEKPAKPAKPAKPGAKEDKPAPASAAGKPGLKLTVVDAQNKEHEGTLTDLTDEALKKALEALKVDAVKSLTLEGEVDVEADGVYQLDCLTSGALEVEWGGRRALEVKTASADRLRFASASLKSGWTALRLTLKPSGASRLSVLLAGDRVATPLGGKALRFGP